MAKLEHLRDFLAAPPADDYLERRSADGWRLAAIEWALILKGSLRCAGKRFRCDAHLVSPEAGMHPWSGSFDSSHRDPFAVEDDFASQISSGVRVATIGE